jgi:hypothetical protein
MEEEEDYFAPFGMSQIDFNSMIRRRNLAELTGQLIEQGRVTLPGTFTVPSSNTAQLMDAVHDAANMPEPLAAGVEEAARPCSSIYSRDIDEGSPSFGTFFDKHRSSHNTSQSQSPIRWPLLSRSNSIRASLSSSCPAPTSSRVTSVSSYNSGTAAPKPGYSPLQPHPSDKTLRMSATESNTLPDSPRTTSSGARSVDTYCSGTAAPKAEFCSLESDPRFYNKSYKPDARAQSLPAAASVSDKVRVSDPMPRPEDLLDGPLAHVVEASKKGDLDLPKAVAALLRKFSRRATLQELQPPVDRFVELARLRRAVHTLEFDFNDTIMISSDLTSVVHVPPLPSLEELPEMEEADELVDVFETHEFFRWRLAKTVHNRLESLRRELRIGDVRKIEHWYRNVVDLVGWRDEEESRMSWSWLENDGFF